MKIERYDDFTTIPLSLPFYMSYNEVCIVFMMRWLNCEIKLINTEYTLTSPSAREHFDASRKTNSCTCSGCYYNYEGSRVNRSRSTK